MFISASSPQILRQDSKGVQKASPELKTFLAHSSSERGEILTLERSVILTLERSDVLTSEIGVILTLERSEIFNFRKE